MVRRALALSLAACMRPSPLPHRPSAAAPSPQHPWPAELPARGTRARTPSTRTRLRATLLGHVPAHLAIGKHTENDHELRYCRAPRFGRNIGLERTRTSAAMDTTLTSDPTYGPT